MDNNRFDVPMFSDNQKTKDCKKVTPDNKIKAKDTVYVDCLSLVNKSKLKGTYTFDSYDKYDNTVYIIDDNLMTYNVLWSDIVLIKKHGVKTQKL